MYELIEKDDEYVNSDLEHAAWGLFLPRAI